MDNLYFTLYTLRSTLLVMNLKLRDFLDTDLQFVKGVGPVLAARFAELLGGRRILDFLLHKPAYIRPRAITESITNATAGDIITIPVLIKSFKPGGKFRNGGRRPAQFTGTDKSGATITIQFFGDSFLDYWAEKLPIGQTRIISGKLEFNNYSGATISHPDFVELPENADKIPKIQAIYPASEGLTQKTFANVRDQIFSAMPEKMGTGDWGLGIEFFSALHAIHYPQSAEDLMPNSEPMMKLAYAELFAHQAAIKIARDSRKQIVNQKSKIRNKKYNLLEKFYANLPFELTGAQRRTIDEIFGDMARPIPMMRLAQGDVGSGKTIVALAAAVNMAESGGQTALLAPTDTLAAQHYEKIKPMCDALGLVCDILTGHDKGAGRREKLTSLKSGRTKIVIGTHALFSQDVEYKDLGLVIIDEQHRFGVAQREALKQKGNNPDLLALSATPIPRTLSMTIYGDMDVSIINEKPAGRLPIKTTKLSSSRVRELVARLIPQIDAGAKVFWVCPLVEESEKLDLMAAESRHKFLKSEIRNQKSEIGLVHGQMAKPARDAVMAEFSAADSDMKVLVSTTVIEVGIDVPAATIMVIENAERFGLAALHQLRGRVGRGNAQSYCILMFGNDIGENGLKRLDVLCESDDGFLIAEQDLMMRGTGELLGLRQSGWLHYHFVDYRAHRDLFKLAARDAKQMTTPDDWTKDLLYIFDRTVNVKA